MITVLDMETGEILERFESPTAMDRTDPAASPAYPIPRLALQEIEAERPANRIPPDLASLDIAEVLARFL